MTSAPAYMQTLKALYQSLAFVSIDVGEVINMFPSQSKVFKMKDFPRLGFWFGLVVSSSLLIIKLCFCHIQAGPQQRVYQETSRLTSRLVINGLRVEDAGRYKCELGPLDSTMQLNVRGKPK